jgi:hypothetical protein
MDHLKITGNVAQQTGDINTVTITAIDADGNIFEEYSGMHNIVFSGAHGAPNGTSPTCSDIDFGTATTLNFTGGVATCDMKLYKKENISIDVTDNTYDSTGDEGYDLDVAVSAIIADNNKTIISASPDPAFHGGNVEIVVTALDAYENQLDNGGDTVDLLVFNGTSEESVSVSDQSNGTYITSVMLNDLVDITIRGTINSDNIGADSDGTSDGIYYLSVIEPTMDHFSISGVNIPIVEGDDVDVKAGNTEELKIEAVNSIGDVFENYAGNKTLNFSGVHNAPDGTKPVFTDVNGGEVAVEDDIVLYFDNGVAHSNFTLVKAENTSIEITDGKHIPLLHQRILIVI